MHIANMITKVKGSVVALALLAGLVGAVIAVPHTALAAVDTTSVCQGVSLSGGSCTSDPSSFTKVIRLVIQIISLVAGIAAVIMIVVAGMRYITSGGDSSKVAGAKSAIIYAIVGLVIVALSQVIVSFVITKAK